MRPFILAVIALALMISVPPNGMAEEALCGRDSRSMARLTAELMRQAGGQPAFEDARLVVFRDETSNAVFLLTKIGHAAHPAAACRRLSAEQGGGVATVQAVCTAPQEACDALKEQARTFR
jgi:hypothetical protein